MNIREENLEEILEAVRPLDEAWLEKARARTAELLMPMRALGRIHELSEQLCAIQESLEPSIARKAVVVMAADHGVAVDGVTAYPQAVTEAMVRTFLSGGAGINVVSRLVGAAVCVVDMGMIADMDPVSTEEGTLLIRKIGKGTRNLSRESAMTQQEARDAVYAGFRVASELIESGVDILATGDMGIGNTTSAAAIGTVITGIAVQDMAGRGAGVDDAGYRRKQEAIARGIALNSPVREDPIDVLAKVGGFEIGGIAGCVLAAAYHRKPVVIDGFISTAGALLARGLSPHVTGYLFAGHCSAEKGHHSMLRHLGLEPILDLGMRLGEGTGAALAMGILEAATRVFREMTTFKEAGLPLTSP